MNISMGFLKPVTGTLKKYKSLLPSVIITVVALLLVLVAMSTKGDVKKGMGGSVRTANSVKPLLKNIPSRREPKQVEIYMDKLEEEANRIKELTTQSSQRDLITYEYTIFPEPEDQSRQVYFGFGKQYRMAIEKLIGAMNALDAPSEAEIRARTGGGRPTASYGGRGARTVAAEDPRIDALCLTRAREVSVYANPSAFAWYPFWESYEFPGKSQALEDCWDSQTAFWVYEDIADTIKKMNGATGNVLSAPVKRLLGVRFTGPVTVATRNTTRGYGRGMGSTGVRDMPNYVASLSPSFFLNDSPTGRVCNDDVDIVHFSVSVLVDSRSIFPFMKELCCEKPHSFYPSVFKKPFTRQGQPVESRHNQITILQSDLKVVDKTESDHELYRYGKGAVVRLDLVCEYQFNRSGYDLIKPKAIKKRLGQPEDTDEQDDTQDLSPGGMMPGM